MPEGAQSEVDLQELLEELGRTGVPDGVRVRVEANGGRRSVMGHYEPLRRAFANLLRNAAEAMHGAGAIDVGLAGDAAGLVVTIADHGPGIDAALRPRVFEPYFTTKADGTGLGLALVRQTMDAHRATITVDETPIGNFLELEGPKSLIDEMAGKLGYKASDYIVKSYLALHQEYLKVRGLPLKDMLFEAS